MKKPNFLKTIYRNSPDKMIGIPQTVIVAFFFGLFSVMTVFNSCTPNKVPFSEIVKQLHTSAIGDFQVAEAGDYFPDSVGISFTASGTEYSADEFNVRFEVIAGGGEVSPDFLTVKNNSMALTKWKTGNEGSTQKLKAVITDKDGNMQYSRTISGTALAPNRWDTIQLVAVPNIHDILFDTLAQKTLVAGGCFIYRQDGTYYEWAYSMPTPDNQCPFQLIMTNDGSYFAAASSGSIYISNDSGNTWGFCAKPVPGYEWSYQLNTTSDGSLWAGCYSEGDAFFVSEDKGQSWVNASAGLQADEFARDIYRLSSGNIYMLSNFGRFYTSADAGISWQRIDAPQYALKFYVTPAKDFILINQDDGITVHKSTDYGDSWQSVFNVRPDYSTSMAKSIHYMNDWFFLLIPGYGILKTQDFEDYTLFYENRDIGELYRNHQAALIAYDYMDNNAYFYYFE